MVQRLKKLFGCHPENGSKGESVKNESHDVQNGLGDRCEVCRNFVQREDMSECKPVRFPYNFYFQVLVTVDKKTAKKILHTILLDMSGSDYL